MPLAFIFLLISFHYYAIAAIFLFISSRHCFLHCHFLFAIIFTLRFSAFAISFRAASPLSSAATMPTLIRRCWCLFFIAADAIIFAMRCRAATPKITPLTIYADMPLMLTRCWWAMLLTPCLPPYALLDIWCWCCWFYFIIFRHIIVISSPPLSMLRLRFHYLSFFSRHFLSFSPCFFLSPLPLFVFVIIHFDIISFYFDIINIFISDIGHCFFFHFFIEIRYASSIRSLHWRSFLLRITIIITNIILASHIVLYWYWHYWLIILTLQDITGIHTLSVIVISYNRQFQIL